MKGEKQFTGHYFPIIIIISLQNCSDWIHLTHIDVQMKIKINRSIMNERHVKVQGVQYESGNYKCILTIINISRQWFVWAIEYLFVWLISAILRSDFKAQEIHVFLKRSLIHWRIIGSPKALTFHRWPAATRWWYMYDLDFKSFYHYKALYIHARQNMAFLIMWLCPCTCQWIKLIVAQRHSI